MEEKELEEFYEQFLKIISTDLVNEIRREGKGYTIEMAVENRLDILREDVKNEVIKKL